MLYYIVDTSFFLLKCITINTEHLHRPPNKAANLLIIIFVGPVQYICILERVNIDLILDFSPQIRSSYVYYRDLSKHTPPFFPAVLTHDLRVQLK